MLFVLPDAVEVTIDWLLDVDDLTELVEDRIGSRLGAQESVPCVVIQRFGGVPVHPLHLDRARLQVSAWGSTEAEASDVARTTHAALHAMEGYEHDTALVTKVIDELGIGSQPDTVRTPPTPRFVFGVAVVLHPQSVTS